MISIIFSLIFFILFIFFCIAGGNYLLKNMIDNILSKNNTETFENLNYIDKDINNMDQCKQIDELSQNVLNFQTATNIPLSPVYYNNYIGSIYIDNDKKNINELQKGKYCLKKSKLLYDGIWENEIITKSPYVEGSWTMTDGNVTSDYYCSDKLIQVNRPFPKNFIDKSAVTPPIPTKYFTYFNDTEDDVFDKEISCFPSVFNAGITEDLKKKYMDDDNI